LQELERQAEQWARADRLRTYLSAVQKRAADHGVLRSESFQGWIVWARHQADGLDPTGVLLAKLESSDKASINDHIERYDNA
jgi:hypothetical protein